MIERGDWQAKVIDYGMTTTQKGTPQAFIVFEVEGQGGITWYGSFKEGKAREITVETLVICGALPSNIDNFYQGPTSGILDTDKPVEIVVDDEHYNGKTYRKVKYVNAPGGGGIKRIKDSLGFSLSGLASEAINKNENTAPRTDTTSTPNLDDIPF